MCGKGHTRAGHIVHRLGRLVTLLLDRTDALALASLVVDLRITQIVNGICGVHAILPHAALGEPRAPA